MRGLHLLVPSLGVVAVSFACAEGTTGLGGARDAGPPSGPSSDGGRADAGSEDGGVPPPGPVLGPEGCPADPESALEFADYRAAPARPGGAELIRFPPSWSATPPAVLHQNAAATVVPDACEGAGCDRGLVVVQHGVVGWVPLDAPPDRVRLFDDGSIVVEQGQERLRIEDGRATPLDSAATVIAERADGARLVLRDGIVELRAGDARTRLAEDFLQGDARFVPGGVRLLYGRRGGGQVLRYWQDGASAPSVDVSRARIEDLDLARAPGGRNLDGDEGWFCLEGGSGEIELALLGVDGRARVALRPVAARCRDLHLDDFEGFGVLLFDARFAYRLEPPAGDAVRLGELRGPITSARRGPSGIWASGGTGSSESFIYLLSPEDELREVAVNQEGLAIRWFDASPTRPGAADFPGRTTVLDRGPGLSPTVLPGGYQIIIPRAPQDVALMSYLGEPGRTELLDFEGRTLSTRPGLVAQGGGVLLGDEAVFYGKSEARSGLYLLSAGEIRFEREGSFLRSVGWGTERGPLFVFHAPPEMPRGPPALLRLREGRVETVLPELEPVGYFIDRFGDAWFPEPVGARTRLHRAGPGKDQVTEALPPHPEVTALAAPNERIWGFELEVEGRGCVCAIRGRCASPPDDYALNDDIEYTRYRFARYRGRPRLVRGPGGPALWWP